MSSPQASGATSPGSGGQLEDAVTTFSDAVFEATQGLLSAQQQLTRALLNGQAGQTQTVVDEEPPDRGDEQGTDPVALDAGSEVDDDAGEIDDEAGEVDEADELDELDDEADQSDEADELDDEADQSDEADELDDEADDEAGDLDDALDDETDEADGQTPGDDAAPAPAAQSGGRPDRRRRPRQATAGRMSSGAAI